MNPKNPRKRLDQRLVDAALVESRERARGLILAGQVRVNGRRVDKPGTLIGSEAAVTIAGPEHPFVGRGGVKLRAALDAFGVDVKGRVCLDVGAGTGGFTDCLLQAGAASVIAVDVGHGHLHPRLRHDPRVVFLERVNVRHLTNRQVPVRPHLAVIDVAFISLTLVIPVVADLLLPDGEIIALVKPQFEVGKGEVGKGGVVRDAQQHGRAIRKVVGSARGLGMVVTGICASPILGAKGNREFFVYLTKGLARPGTIGDVECLIEETVGSGSGEVLERKVR
jgi:23S rRNA (cytidine1920-2'-O)/16S rRNA (cytidine1409-2'-O)-methyltransferase